MPVQKPGPTAGGKLSPGTTAKLNPAPLKKPEPAGPPVPPQRPRMPSRTDEIDAQTGAPTERKGVTPRAPSVVSAREVTTPSLDIKELIASAVKEATAPLHTRIAQLEGRLAVLESDANERSAAEETRPNVVQVAAVPVPPPVIMAPAFGPASPFSTIPVSASAFAPVPSPAPPSVSSADATEKSPAATAVALPAARPAFVSRPQINFEDAHLSPDEVAMFDGNKRSRRMTIYFLLVLVLLGGLLGVWAYISRS